MGTLLAIATIVIAIVLTSASFGPHFWLLAAMLIVMCVAALLRPNPAVFVAGTFLAGFSALMINPIVASTDIMRALRRAARGDDAEAAAAQSAIEFYDGLAVFAAPVEIAIALLVVGATIFAARRSLQGFYPFLLEASEGIAAFIVRVGQIATVLFIPMILFILYDVVQRKYLDFDPEFTNTQIYSIFTSTRLQEAQWHLHAALFLLTFGFAYVKDAHVRIELVRERLGRRTRVWIELLGCCLFLIPYCFVIFTYGYEFARNSYNIGEVSSALTGLPYRFIIKSILPIGFVILALAGLSVALKCIVYLFGPEHLRARSGYYAGTHHADMPEQATAS
ncbi:MAG: TRAP transporter small permease subunit [Pseudomonadota bacterium]